MSMTTQILCRVRKVTVDAENGGKECVESNENLMQYRICRKDRHIVECPRKRLSTWGSWQEWSDCRGECGKRGKRERIKLCISIDGGECEDEIPRQSEECPRMCPESMSYTVFICYITYYYRKEFFKQCFSKRIRIYYRFVKHVTL